MQLENERGKSISKAIERNVGGYESTGSDHVACREARHGDAEAAEAENDERLRLENGVLPAARA